MSNAGALAAIEYEAESAWAENVTTFATHRIPILGAVDTSKLVQPKIEPQRVVQYLQDGTPHIIGPIGGSITMRLHLTGHGSTTSGATTADAMETFLSFVFGKLTISAAAGTTFTGGTVTAPTTTASGTFAAGSLCRAGVLGDGRGNGQWAAISTHVTTTLNLLTALPGAPNNGDVLFSAANLYIPEDPTDAAATITGIRMRVLTANLRYELHGCYPTGARIGGLNPGETPFIEIDWGVSWWAPTAGGTYPSTVTSNAYNPAPIAAGSVFMNDVATTTRATRTVRSFQVDLGLGVVPLVGPGGVNAYQTVVGAKRIPSTIKVSWIEDADAATATPSLEAKWLGTTKQHVLFSGSVTAGSAFALYFRQLCISGARPVQVANGNINRIAIEAMAYTGPTTTSALTLAAMVMGFA